MDKDLFSTQAEIYARFRPGYPEELFEYILSFVTNRESAWDAGTGNGQAAFILSRFFKTVIGTDISELQLLNATKGENIRYQLSRAESVDLPDHSIDLITVAQAYHWFNFEAFAREALRVGKPGAVIAVWCYSLPKIHDNNCDTALLDFYKNVVGAYWDPERHFIDERYETIPFPFIRLPGKTFSMSYSWNREQLLGYVSSWSAVQHYKKANGDDPVKALSASITPYWPDGMLLPVEFPLYVLLGRKPLSSKLSKDN